VYPDADADSTQPVTVAAAVLVSDVNDATPLAFVVALPVIEQAADAAEITTPAAGVAPFIAFTCTGVPTELNGALVMVDPMNASAGIVTYEIVHVPAGRAASAVV